MYDSYTTIKWKMICHEINLVKDDSVLSEYGNKTFQELVESLEEDVILWGLKKYGTTRALAAQLKVHHSRIVKKMQKKRNR